MDKYSEDTILAKRVYGSYQDIDDAKSILLRQGKRLDMDYLKKQAKHFDVLGALDSLTRR